MSDSSQVRANKSLGAPGKILSDWSPIGMFTMAGLKYKSKYAFVKNELFLEVLMDKSIPLINGVILHSQKEILFHSVWPWINNHKACRNGSVECRMSNYIHSMWTFQCMPFDGDLPHPYTDFLWECSIIHSSWFLSLHLDFMTCSFTFHTSNTTYLPQ